MPEITYEIVEHDGGWAYKVGGAFSEPFPTHAAALAAAKVAAAEQEQPGQDRRDRIRGRSGQVAHRDRARPRPPAHVSQG